MLAATTRGELAELAARLPQGVSRDWCELSAAGPAAQIVYADSEMLSHCRESANPTDESLKESNDGNVSRQSKRRMERETQPREDS